MATTPPALLAQLQSLWQAAAPPIMSTAAETPCREKGEADHVDIAAGVCLWPTEMVATDLGPFALIGHAEREYLLGRHRFAEPCGFCGGRAKHNTDCVALSEDWHVKMPWGKHRGKPIAETDPRYLRWLLKSGKELETELRREIERVLGIEQGG